MGLRWCYRWSSCCSSVTLQRFLSTSTENYAANDTTLRMATELVELARENRKAKGKSRRDPSTSSSSLTLSNLRMIKAAPLRELALRCGIPLPSTIPKPDLVNSIYAHLSTIRMEERPPPPTIPAPPLNLNPSPQQLLDTIEQHLIDLRCQNIDIIDLRHHDANMPAAIIVICSGTSLHHAWASGSGIVYQLRQKFPGLRQRLNKGDLGNVASDWVCVDLGSIIVNIMTPEARAYYDLEGLWKDQGGGNVRRVDDPRTLVLHQQDEEDEEDEGEDDDDEEEEEP